MSAVHLVVWVSIVGSSSYLLVFALRWTSNVAADVRAIRSDVAECRRQLTGVPAVPESWEVRS